MSPLTTHSRQNEAQGDGSSPAFEAAVLPRSEKITMQISKQLVLRADTFGAEMQIYPVLLISGRTVVQMEKEVLHLKDRPSDIEIIIGEGHAAELIPEHFRQRLIDCLLSKSLQKSLDCAGFVSYLTDCSTGVGFPWSRFNCLRLQSEDGLRPGQMFCIDRRADWREVPFPEHFGLHLTNGLCLSMLGHECLAVTSIQSLLRHYNSDQVWELILAQNT